MFQDKVKLLESTLIHRKPNTTAGEDASVVKLADGE